MGSVSNQSLDSEENKRFLQIESYDEHIVVDDEISRHIDSCPDEEVDGIAERSKETSSMKGDVEEPYLGMEFKSREEAREYYIIYGRHVGFTVRMHHNRRSRINNMVIGQDFVCSKEGFREKKYECRKDRVLPPPPVTREGCPAMLRLALRDGQKWAVTKFVRDHNHSFMSPSEVPLRGSGKILISEDEKDQRIRELTIELQNERQRCKRRCAAYAEQLRTILKDVEQHTGRLSKTVEDVVQSIADLENDSLGDHFSS